MNATTWIPGSAAELAAQAATTRDDLAAVAPDDPVIELPDNVRPGSSAQPGPPPATIQDMKAIPATLAGPTLGQPTPESSRPC